METLSKEEVKMYRSKLFTEEMEKPEIGWFDYLLYSLVAIIVLVFLMFFMTVTCVLDNSKPIDSCRYSASGQVTSFIIQKTILNK